MLKTFLRVCALVTFTATPALGEEIRDYYAEPGINPFKETINDSFHESVDPFSGTLQLKYTDLHIPGNGAMDVSITRTYTSLQTNSYPTLNQNGLGWTMHFGRIVISKNHLPKLCNQGSFPLTTKENPSLELPDGGREILALSSMHNDGTMITRSNWIAKCVNGNSMLVTAPNGTRYTMDRFDNFQEEPALLTTRIEDIHGNWIAIDYASNSLGINYITQIRRSDDGVVATFQYEDLNTPGIAVSSITAGSQTVSYGYESIPGFFFDNYKQLVRATRPDGRSWVYAYNPKMSDPDPNDDLIEDGIASYSLTGVTYPYGAHIGYTYQYVRFDPGAPTERTTAIQTKIVSGGDVTGGTWTYQFAPHSSPYNDNYGGTLRYDVTTVTAPEATYIYRHYGKDFRAGALGQTIFIRPSYVGLLNIKETWSRAPNARLLERLANSWGDRKISNEDFWHGGGYRAWWRDDGTYAPVLTGEYVSRDQAIAGSTYAHARLFFDHDAFGNPGRVYSHSNVTSQPGHQVLHTYYNNVASWIIGVADDETHQKVVNETETTLGTIERDINSLGQVTSVDEFGETTHYTYHSDGELHTVRDARNKTTTYTNYKRGIARNEARPESVNITRVVNDDGTLRSESDGRGNVTRYTYDDLHRLTSIDYPIKADVGISYDPGAGSYRRILTRANYRHIDTINDFGQTLRVERRDTITDQSIYRTSRFDAFGREIFTSYPNNTIGTTTEYDALGRPERIRHPDNSFVRYGYDDATTTVTNERGHQSVYLYGFLGTGYSQDDPAVIREPENVSTNIWRDVWGNITELFQGERTETNSIRGYGKTYRYDDRNLLVESIEPEVGTTIYGHDEVGNVVSERVNDLPIVTFEYDGLNRRTRVNFSDTTPDIVTVYDDASNVERVTKGTTEWFYTYDENGNLRSERLTVDHPLFAPRVYTIGRDYSDIDVLSTLTYPSGLAVNYEPDAFGRATRVGTFASGIGYHPSGGLASYQLANGVTTTIGLNQRLLTQTISAPGVVNLTYGYDVGGNVMNINDGIDSSKNVVMNTTSYDGLDRLRYTRGHWGTANFTYDFHGNFKTKEIGQRGLKYGLDSKRRARQVSRYQPGFPDQATGVIGLDYDKRGNAIARRSIADANLTTATLDEKFFDFDAASHLVRARVTRTTVAGTTAIASKDYAYDGNGQRVLEHKRGSYDIRFSVHGKDGHLMFEDVLADCTRTDHIRLGAMGIAKSDDQILAPALDTDNDQITDCYETALGLNPNSAADAAADTDGDGLTNLQEFRAGTSMTNADTDGDGLSDRDELERDLTDPNSADSDGDGLADGVEAANPQLDPRNADKDHDGVTDYWETRLQTNSAAPDGLLDSDSDGFSNRQESGAKSDPQVAITKPDRGGVIWSASLLTTIYSNATIGADRTVYVVGDDGRLYAYWPDGTRRFVYGMPGVEKILAPTVGPDGSIYVVVNIYGGVPTGAPRSYLRALNPDGTQLWSWGTADYVETSVTVGEGGRLYFSGYRFNGWQFFNFVGSLSGSGTEPSMRFLDYTGTTPAAVAPNGDVFFVSTSRLMAFTKTLEPRWTYNLRANSNAPLSISKDSTVYAGDNNGYLYAVRPDGTLRWEKQISNGPQRSAVAIAADGALYVGGYRSVLLSLNPADGTTRWSASTTGTTYTPALAADGTIYATTFGGDVMAFDPAGAPLWRYSTGGRVYAAPVLDRDGTLYVGTETAQIYAIADNGGGPARSPWPMERHDSASTGNVCFNELASSLLGDSDGDRIDDCSEYRYGLDPANAADGAQDMDGDGLRNFEEHQHGSRLDVADTDGDGLNDGLEVLTYHTNPAAADTDHDTIADGTEVAMNTNPLDASDASADYDGDGFSNRQESLAGTDPRVATSMPSAGQLARSQAPAGKGYVVARDGTIYRVVGDYTSAMLEALYPDFTSKWRVSAPSISNGSPVIGADGSIYMVEPRNGETQRVVAFWPNGLVRWAYSVNAPSAYYGITSKPTVGADGTVYFSYTTNSGSGDMIIALTPEGLQKPGWNVFSYFGTDGEMAIGQNGTVAVFDPANSLTLLSATGTRLWDNRSSPIRSGGGGYVAFGADGTIYARNALGLMAVNPTNGSVRWRVPNTNGQPIVDSANRVLGYCDQYAERNMCAIDSTGAIVWTETTGYTFSGSPAIDASGAILVYTTNDRFVAFNENGSVRWQAALPASTGTKRSDGPIVMDDATIFVPASPQDHIILGTGRGLADTTWPARDRDNRGSRSAGVVALIVPNPAPAVMITDPRIGPLSLDIAQARTVRAQASDSSQGDLTAAIVWTSSLDGQLGTGATATLTNISVGAHTITATVTDNENLTASKSFEVTKGIIAPVVYLGYPTDGQIYDVGQQVPFSGSATDQRDGYIADWLRWSSSRDGALGTGTSFYRTNLTVGTHVITAAVTDSSGTSDSKSVTIQVALVGPNITHYPQNLQEVELGLATQFSGEAYDPVDGNVSETLRWTSDRDGLIGTGPNFTRSDLTAGTHVITVTAQDSGGTTTTKTFSILVRAMPPSIIIEYPFGGAGGPPGTDIMFAGGANDVKDGDISDNIQWSSSLDGPVGTGRGYFFRNDLSAGVHLITALITDSDGASARAERYIYITDPANASPWVSISSPGDGSQHYATDPVTLTASAQDTESGSITAIQWSSDRDGVLGTGTSLSTSTLSVGTHRIKAFVADSGGAKAASFVIVEIVPMPANFAPTVYLNDYGRGSQYTSQSAFSLSGTATDREDGDISQRIQWSSNLNGALGSGKTIFVSGLAAGFHSITTTVTDNYGATVSTSSDLEILDSGTARFLEDLFDYGGPPQEYEWVVFDDGTPTPSYWLVQNGRMTESGDAQAGDAAAAAVPKPGTYLIQTTGANWLDYRVEATLRSSDDDALGLMFRYVDNDNYYRFSMDRERSYRRLVKKVNGVFTTLWQDATRYSVNSNVNVAITAQGSQLTLAINGTQLYSAVDTAHRRGTIALYAWGENQAQFDNVRVFNLRTTTSNDPPLVTISSPANNTTVLVGTPLSLSGTALDFEDGTLSPSLSWSSSRDGVLGIGPSLSVSTLTVGAHVITASSTDSRATTGTATVNVTVNEPFNNPPTLSVSAPTEGATFNVGTMVNFAGTASDAEDGTISNGITWTSSRSGLLGTGATLSASLVAGTHTITARIQDSGLKFTTVVRNITVVVPNNNQPTITLTTPLNGAAFGVGQSVALAATAADTEDGNITSAIAWSSNRVGALGTGGTVNTTVLNHGIHTITATVNDSMGGTRSVTRTINVVSTAATLVRDDFNDNNFTGWTVTDQGTVTAPSAWSASTGTLRQTADIHSTPTTAATVPKTGTFNRYTSGSSWTNYSVTTELRAGDNDTLGVMFRYTSTSNYYRFSMDSELAQRRLTKVRNGTWTTLWSDATAYQLNRTYVLEVIANGATITVKLDGVQLWSGTDSNALTSGTVAMYSWRNTDARFDNVLVRNLSVAFSNANEPRRGLDRLQGELPILASREPKPKPVPPRAPERIALVTSLTSDYRQTGGGVR